MLDAADFNLSPLQDPQDEWLPSTDQPVSMLGFRLSAHHDRDIIFQKVNSIFWFSYRKGFSSIGESTKKDDSGWGCMIRCGQMIMAETLRRRHLPREWYWSEEEVPEYPVYRKLLEMFVDIKSALYSIHQICLMGESEGKQVGQWFGPNTIAQVLKRLSRFDQWGNIFVHVAMDNTVSLKPIASSSYNASKPLLLIIPLRLGLSELNPVYIPCLKKCFALRQSVGVIGGRPNHALYFIGCVDSQVIYLDPHVSQSFSLSNDASYHCSSPGLMNIADIDPSVALGFYCKDKADFENLIHNLKKEVLTDQKHYPLFEIVEDVDESLRGIISPIQRETSRTISLSEYDIVNNIDADEANEEFEII